MKNPAVPDTEQDHLNPKQRAFVAAYAASGSPTRAAREAGYPHADVQGSRLLRNIRVQAAIASITSPLEKRLREAIAQVEERRTFWTTVMRDPDVGWRERLRASELLGRSYGDFIERIQAESNLEFSITRKIIMGGARENADTLSDGSDGD